MNEEVYDTNLISADFFHQYFSITGNPLPEVVPIYATSSTKLEIFIITKEFYCEKIFNGIQDGYIVYVHDPYELPTKSSNHVNILKNGKIILNVEPILNAIDESLVNLNIDV